MPRALLYDEVGSVDVFYLSDVPDLPLVTGQVRVDVRAAGTNPFDFKLRYGKIKIFEMPFPRGIGQDFAGVVSEVSGDLKYFDGSPIQIGDEVLGWSEQQAIRESLTVEFTTIIPKPAGLSWADAGSLQTPGLTAIACLDYLQIGSQDVVFVSAAAGGVGLIYSQLAKLRGARVIGSSSRANFDLLRSIGVEPVSYEATEAEEIRALAPNGLTAVQDNVGKPTLDLVLDELDVPKDRICSIGDHGYSSTIGVGSPGMYERVPKKLADLAKQVAEGQVVLPKPREFALNEYRAAFELLESRHGTGKIVILP